MSLKVRYFASLRERVGRGEDELPVGELKTVRDVWCAANPNMPQLERVLAAINYDYADFDSIVHDGDEVAFFPPVTGG